MWRGFSLPLPPLHFTSLNPTQNVSARAIVQRSQEEVEAAAPASPRLWVVQRAAGGSAGEDSHRSGRLAR